MGRKNAKWKIAMRENFLPPHFALNPYSFCFWISLSVKIPVPEAVRGSCVPLVASEQSSSWRGIYLVPSFMVQVTQISQKAQIFSCQELENLRTLLLNTDYTNCTDVLFPHWGIICLRLSLMSWTTTSRARDSTVERLSKCCDADELNHILLEQIWEIDVFDRSHIISQNNPILSVLSVRSVFVFLPSVLTSGLKQYAPQQFKWTWLHSVCNVFAFILIGIQNGLMIWL